MFLISVFLFQTEMFKDDMLSERKDRERAQAQREKMRRDLEILQSRNQSLQEQVRPVPVGFREFGILNLPLKEMWKWEKFT